MSPVHRSGGTERSRPGDHRVAPGMPAAISAAAPRTGRSAAEPGNGVVGEYVVAAAMIAPTPAQPRMLAAVDGTRPRNADVMASRAPMPSSQARAGEEK